VSIGSYLPGRRWRVGHAWNLHPVTGKVRLLPAIHRF